MIIFPLKQDKSPAVPKGTTWQTYQGEANTAMVGVMIPEGVIVLDIDTYKGCTTAMVDAALGVELNWNLAELQSTLNGGRHYVFRVPVDADMTNGSNLLGVKGFDTRASLKGYIATGKGYDNLTMHDTVAEALHDLDYWGELPLAAIEKLRSGALIEAISPASDDVFDLQVAVRSTPLDLTQEEVTLYVDNLPVETAQDSDQWLKVGMALWHQSEGASWGWELFDKFSKTSPSNYDLHKNRKRWESFGKNRDSRSKPITFATVIDMAGGNKVVVADQFDKLKQEIFDATDKESLVGIIEKVADLRLTELDSTIVIKELQKKFIQIVGEKLSENQVKRIIRKSKVKNNADFHEDYVYLTSSAEYMDKVTKVKIGQRAFDVKHDRITPPDTDGLPQRASTYVNNKIECVYSGMYAPMFNDFFTYDGVEYFNTYKPSTLKRIPQGTTDIVDRIKGHFAHLLPDHEEQQLLINFLAHNVQFIGRKMQWGMLLQGVQGDGKSFIGEMMKHVLGTTNCRSITAEALDEKFTGWAEGSSLITIEELKLDNHRKYDTLNKLKPYIANSTISVRRMQRDLYEAINTTNYLAFTNYKDALPIDNNDRRYCVLFSQWQSKDRLMEFINANPNYYSDLYNDMRGNTGEILDWLMSHPIPDSFMALNRAPDTSAKHSMLQMNKGADYLLVEDAINEFECEDVNNHIVNVTKLYKLATDRFNDGYELFPKDARLRNILLDMGYHNIGRYKNRHRKNQTIYCKDDKEKAINFQFVINKTASIFVPEEDGLRRD